MFVESKAVRELLKKFGITVNDLPINVSGYTNYDIKPSQVNEAFHIYLHVNNDFSSAQSALIRDGATYLVTYKSAYQGIFGYLDGLINSGMKPSEGRKRDKPLVNGDGQNVTFGDDLEEKYVVWTSFYVSMFKYGIISANVFVDYFDEAPPTGNSGTWTTGDGVLDYFNDHHELRIRLNRSYVNFDLAGYNGKNPKLWSGVIAHEIMHNLGWTHDTKPLSNTYIVKMTQYFSDFVHNFDKNKL